MQPSHVAPDRQAVRHASPRMSHRIGKRCGMPAFACRTASRTGATCQPSHVARDQGPARHGSLRMSHGIKDRCDLVTIACRATRPRRATCKGERLDPYARVVRRASTATSPLPPVTSDMGRGACRTTQSCGATWTTMWIAGPGLVERHGRPRGSPRSTIRSLRAGRKRQAPVGSRTRRPRSVRRNELAVLRVEPRGIGLAAVHRRRTRRRDASHRVHPVHAPDGIDAPAAPGE